MKKNLLIVAIAITALAGCTEETFVGEKSLQEANGNAAISFNMGTTAVTRAEGASAAAKLNSQFVVYAEKNEANDGSAPTAGNLVIKNYQVKWTAGSENSTTSNTEGWEYVGFASQFPTQVTPVSTETQTIKYWDYSASSYTFTAISALPADLTGGKMTIAKTTASTGEGASPSKKGYVVTISSAANLSSLFFADRVVVTKPTSLVTPDRHADNAYGGNVTFNFRNALSEVRIGMYETIPGYEITEVKFYKNDGSTEILNSEATPAKACGTIISNYPATGFTGTLTVTYDALNQPIVEPASSTAKATELVLGKNIQTLTMPNPSAEPEVAGKYLGTSSSSPTWDTDGGTYTKVFPQPSNTTDMVLKVDYTLYNTVTKETIEVKGATAKVPGEYVAWKSNFKYTYIFKISENTNGTTDPTVGPVGLYPITFDAAVIEAEDGKAEYITTVSEPSITTFGVNSTTGKYVSGGSEYAAGSDIYATIIDGSSIVDPNSKYNVYTVTTTDATNFPITEASVAESISEISAKTHNVTCTTYAGTKSLETSVPGEDGNTITLSEGKAIKLPALAANTYAIEYVKTARTYKAQAVTYETQAEYDAAFAKVNLYTDHNTNTAAVAGSWSSSNKTFYKKVVDNVGVYAYKIIVVQ